MATPFRIWVTSVFVWSPCCRLVHVACYTICCCRFFVSPNSSTTTQTVQRSGKSMPFATERSPGQPTARCENIHSIRTILILKTLPLTAASPKRRKKSLPRINIHTFCRIAPDSLEVLTSSLYCMLPTGGKRVVPPSSITPTLSVARPPQPNPLV